MKITFLGTTCMHPTKERNHSGTHISFGSERMLFDCGEGIQRQMRIAKLKLAKITKIFITHWHGDHAIGLAGLLTSIGADQCKHTIEIYGPRGSKKKFEMLKKVFPSMNSAKHEIHEICSEGIVLDYKDFVIESYRLNHSVPCIGFALREKDRLKIDMEKAKKVGLSEGPIMAKIRCGENVKVGIKTIKAKDITYEIKGKKISYIMDTGICNGAMKLAKNSDIMIIESTYHSEDQGLAIEYKHLSSKDCGEIAKKSNVCWMYLTHPSPRYKNVTHLTKEAKEYHKKTKFAQDFMEVEL